MASQVVFIDGLPAKQHYRKYKIRSSSIRSGHSDDFMAMAEIMRRRFRRGAKPRPLAPTSLSCANDAAQPCKPMDSPIGPMW